MKSDKQPRTAKKGAPRAEEEQQPRPEIPTTPRVSEIPERPSRETAQHDPERARERAENEGMPAMPPPERVEHAERTEGVEGEGSYSATHRYQEGIARSVQQGDADRLAEEAARALDGPEGQELRRAEKDAKAGPRPAHARSLKKAG